MIQPKAKFLLLAALFAAPLAGAALLYFVFPELIPGGRLNYGTLIEPARPLPALQLRDVAGVALPDSALKGKWSLVYLGGADCRDACQQRLLLTRQVRLALNKGRMRVQRVYLAPDGAAAAAAQAALAAEHPDLVFIADIAASGARAADFFTPADSNDLFLLDPLANWLMVYTGEVQAKGLHKDLKKLLRFSQIG
jgi:cytochrome oxidase Cu insertion factor (SCO1/SenC/PrrC family)